MKLSEQHPQLAQELQTYHPVKTAAIFAGLLLEPKLQSNCHRLERMIHLALACGKGMRGPSDNTVARWFKVLGQGSSGYLEDPAEDVFVGNIATIKGNFLVLEGMWESATFYLQRFTNILANLPSSPGVDEIRDNIFALLKLSNLACKKAKLKRYQLGGAYPLKELPQEIKRTAVKKASYVSFTDNELQENEINLESLAEFGLLPEMIDSLDVIDLNNTPLERYPLLRDKGITYLALPSNVSLTIERYIIERFEETGLRETLLQSLASEYRDIFINSPMFGTRLPDIPFVRTKNSPIASMSREVDKGRYLNLIFVIDNLEGFAEDGFSGSQKNSAATCADIDAFIDVFYEKVSKQTDFRDSLTLLVVCGVGRFVYYEFNKKVRPNWRFIGLSAADFYTLCWMHEITLSSFWRLLDGEEELEKLNIHIQNINGLLNLIAWVRSLGGQMVPHGDISVGPSNDAPLMISIPQNGLCDLRAKYYQNSDPHAELDGNNEWIKVRRLSESIFESEKQAPLYSSERYLGDRGFPSVFVTDTRRWWAELKKNPSAQQDENMNRWRMVRLWLARAAPILEKKFKNLPLSPLTLEVQFEGTLSRFNGQSEFTEFSYEQAIDTIQESYKDNKVSLFIKKEFDDAVASTENIAERALVAKIIEGFAHLAGSDIEAKYRDEIAMEAVGNSDARQMHFFRAKTFRDLMRHYIPEDHIVINRDDDAALRLGLGWRVTGQERPSEIEGRTECVKFLNDTVKSLEDELCNHLKNFSREQLVTSLLLNHERATVDRDRWRSTSRAILAIDNNSEDAHNYLTDKEMTISGVLQASRLLTEIAICECPLTGKLTAGEFDLSKMMAMALQIATLGGWSDAIRWEAMEPHLRIATFGDILASYKFFDEVVKPFARAGSNLTVKSSAKSYDKRLDLPLVRTTVADMVDPQFIAAWQKEFGVSLDEVRAFIDVLEDMGFHKNKPVFSIRKSEIRKTANSEIEITDEAVAACVELLTFPHRNSWRRLPDGFKDSDRQPWRFRRKLSILRLPLLQVTNDPDPLYIISPGMARDALAYTVNGYLRGDFPIWQIKTKEMISWTGKAANARGNDFAKEVGDFANSRGWHAEAEVPVSQLLGIKLDRNYGDVDVLAYRADSDRVLLVECKDVLFKKTPGEIAEQLLDFKGVIKETGEADHLKKHLDRIDVISANLDRVTAYTGIKEPKIEGHLIFRNIVPMQFAWEELKSRIALHTFDSADKLFGRQKFAKSG